MAMSMLVISPPPPPPLVHPILGSKLTRRTCLSIGSNNANKNSGFLSCKESFSSNRTYFRICAFDHSMETVILEELRNGKPVTASKDDANSHQNIVYQSKYSPLVKALKAEIDKNHATFQFPGHNRGHLAPSSLTQLIGMNPFLYDVGEIDDLGSPHGPILEAQRQAAELFGASETCFLVGGTTCGVIAAIMGTCGPGDTIILPRNCHISAISGLVLCGAIPKYIFPNYDFDWEIATSVSPAEVEKAIKEVELEGKKAAAVFITSPTYHGICSNVKDIATICHSRGIPLIVDEAHGAHFGFHPKLPISALQQGANIVIQSTHKVLLSLTQSSMLHLSGEFIDKEAIITCLRALQSTSPSFLLLASLDASTAFIKENPPQVFDNSICLANEAKTRLKQIPGISILESPFLHQGVRLLDPLRVTVGVSGLGLTGYEATELIYKDERILPVLPGSRGVTFLFTPGTCRDHVNRLIIGFNNLSMNNNRQKRKNEATNRIRLNSLIEINVKLNPRDAHFAKKKRVEIKDCLGKISGELICPYPPGIPVMIPGEVISEKALEIVIQAQINGEKVSGASDPKLLTILICDV